MIDLFEINLQEIAFILIPEIKVIKQNFANLIDAIIIEVD